MNYLDTSIIIILLDQSDYRFTAVNDIVASGQTIISDLALVELTSFLSRNNIENSLAFAVHIIKKYKIDLLSTIGGSFIPEFGSINTWLYHTLNLSERLKLRTLDLIHVSYCIDLKDNDYEINNLFTADKEFIKSKELLEEHKISLRIIQ